MAKNFNNIKTYIDFDDRVTFGKFNDGKTTWLDVCATEPDYLIWCVGNTDNWFEYDLIVSAIKNKYDLKKRTTKTMSTQQMIGEVSNLDDWFDDVPF